MASRPLLPSLRASQTQTPHGYDDEQAELSAAGTHASIYTPASTSHVLSSSSVSPSSLSIVSTPSPLSTSSPPPGSISYYVVASSSGNNADSQEADDDDDESKRLAKKPRKKRSGWGPYQSVLRERSVDFNLTLDVQNLKQEIKNMEMFRTILLNKNVIQRHDPEGSLVRKAKEHYRVMRSGFNLQETGRKRMYSEQDQKEWIKSIFDEDVDVGNGVHGMATLIEQIKLYSLFINFISITMTGFDVVVTDDSVLVATHGILHFQITRTTITSMFPHIMGEEWLVAKLVGQELHGDSNMNFYFNKNDKVSKFEVQLDLVKSFIGLLKDPREVDILLGRALIASNSMIGITEEDLPPPKSSADSATSESDVGSYDGRQSPPSPASIFSDEESDDDAASHSESQRAAASLRATASASSTAPPPAVASVHEEEVRAQQPGPLTPTDHFTHVVKGYFREFASGSNSAAAVSVQQREYLNRNFSNSVGYGSAVGRQVVEDRWRSLCWCFGTLSFRQMSQEPLAYTPIDNLYLIQTTAEYAMQITVRTVEQVFPHLLSDLALMDSIVGSTIRVQAQLTFWLEKDTGLVASITEQMDFEGALAHIATHPDDLSFVISRALPTLYGFVGEVVADPTAVNDSEEDAAGSSPISPTESAQTASPSTAKMSLSSILG